MGVDHRRTYIAMSKQFLDRSNVIAIFQQMSRERVAQGMTPHRLGYVCLPRCGPDGLLQHGFVQVMPAPFSGSWVHTELRGREHPLPPPLPGRMRILPCQSVRQVHFSVASPQVLLMQLTDMF